MSRDHYKGVPKTRDAVVKADGTLAPLGLLADDVALTAPHLMVKSNEPVFNAANRKVIVARITGDDKNGDGTLENPYRTCKRALEDIPAISDNFSWWVDITGIGTETSTAPLILPAHVNNTGRDFNYFSPNGGVGVGYESALNIYAGLTVLEEMTVTGSAETNASKIKNISDSSKSWTPGEHKGKYLVDDTGYGVGVVYDNDATTLYTPYPYAAPVGVVRICELSAKLDYGTQGADRGVVLRGSTSNVTFHGIEFDNAVGYGGFHMETLGDVNVNSCKFVGGGSVFNSRSCSFNSIHVVKSVGAVLYTYHMSAVFWASYFENAIHQDQGQFSNASFAQGLRIEGNDKPFGHSTDIRVHGGWRYGNVSISGSVGDGISAYDGWCQLDDAFIEHTGGDACYITDRATMHLKRVTGGEGVAGYGVNIGDYGFCDATTGVTISGALGDVKCGQLAVESWTALAGDSRLDTTADVGMLARVRKS